MEISRLMGVLRLDVHCDSHARVLQGDHLLVWLDIQILSLHSPPFNEPLSSSSVFIGTTSTASLFRRLYNNQPTSTLCMVRW